MRKKTKYQTYNHQQLANPAKPANPQNVHKEVVLTYFNETSEYLQGGKFSNTITNHKAEIFLTKKKGVTFLGD